MSERITTLHTFVKARAGERPVVTPTFWESLGYALGRAEAYLDCGDIVGAARQLGWFRTEARKWSEHPEFPTEAAR
ncbi:MICOS complex subunit MIC60 [Streptomyces sp. ARC14]|uniref:hypothetical protein n=1 Tax=Streptomyces sp. ARC14 TaxID=2724152 RepID=UPI0038578F1A